MKQVFHYLGRRKASILIIVLLLVGQATSELMLPSYNRRIVNIGVQQYGILNTAPEIAGKAEFEKLTAFMDSSDRDFARSFYVQESSPPEVTNAPDGVYTRKEADADDLARLNRIFAKALHIDAALDEEILSGEYAAAATSGKARQAILNYANSNFPDLVGSPQSITLLPEDERRTAAEGLGRAVDSAYETESSMVESAIPYVRRADGLIGIDVESRQVSYLVKSGLMMLAFSALAALIGITNGFFSARVSSAYGRDVRRDIYTKVMSFSSKEMNDFSTASLITRSTNDVTNTQQMIMMGLRIVIFSPILAIGGFINIVRTNASMAWIVFLAVACTIITVITLFRIVTPRFQLVQKFIDNMNMIMREILSGLPVIRAFGTSEHETGRFDKVNDDLRRLRIFINRRMSLMFPMMSLFMNSFTVLIVYVGGNKVMAGAMRVGDIQAYISYTMQIIMSFQMISMISIQLPRALISIKRIQEILDTEASITDPQVPEQFDEARKGEIVFDNVSFRYPGADEDVLTGISFTASPGQTTAIIGGTGSGKSTLISLIPRFFDVTGGSVSVSGRNVKSVEQAALRSTIGYIPQNPSLFSGTIESNIKFSDPDIPDDQMERAARIAQASEFIEEKPDTYYEPISQAGTNVSGGQKQRLSIARAVAKNPDIYIFDDSFSAVDFTTDVALRRALNEEVAGAAVLIVAQRISTIMHADKIIVLDSGKLAGAGTHASLLKDCEIYRQIALSQLSEEELNRELSE